MRSKTQMLTLASVFAAIILVTVMFPFLRILHEYAHIGDGIIYLACAILPAPYAMLAAATGSALADTFLGAFLPWAPITVVIKAAMAWVMCRFVGGEKLSWPKTMAGLLLASALNVGGYFLASWLWYGLGAAVAGVPLNLAQSAVAAVLFLALLRLVRRAARKYIR